MFRSSPTGTVLIAVRGKEFAWRTVFGRSNPLRQDSIPVTRYGITVPRHRDERLALRYVLEDLTRATPFQAPGGQGAVRRSSLGIDS